MNGTDVVGLLRLGGMGRDWIGLSTGFGIWGGVGDLVEGWTGG